MLLTICPRHCSVCAKQGQKGGGRRAWAVARGWLSLHDRRQRALCTNVENGKDSKKLCAPVPVVARAALQRVLPASPQYCYMPFLVQ